MRIHLLHTLALVLLLVGLAPAAHAQSSTADVKRITDSVVRISATAQVKSYREPWQAGGTGQGVGTGFIVAGDRIMTNAHVVSNARFLQVQREDSAHAYEARVLFIAHDCDLALLTVDDPTFYKGSTPLDFGGLPHLDSQVAAFGFPIGGNRLSVTRGIVSRLEFGTYSHSGMDSHLTIQVDAAINPGNSGGPLVNLDAELIGINLAIRADAQGIGFAIPLKRIEDVLAGWMLPSRFGMNEIGLVPGTMLDSQGVPYAVVRRALPDTPAARAGLKDGDRIDAVDGVPVRQSIEISRILWRLTVGDAVVLTLHDGRDVRVVVGALKPLSGEEVAQQYFHLEVQELTPRLAAALRLPYTRGLVISGVEPGSLLDRQGIVRGDVIIQVGEAPISCFADLGRALLAAHPGDVVPVIFDRIQSVRGRMVLHRFSLAVTI